MYNVVEKETGLGQASNGFLENLQRAVESGFNIYDKIQQIKNVTEIRKQVQSQANIMARIAPQPMMQSVTQYQPQPMYIGQRYSSGVSWGIIGAIGVGAIALTLLLLKR